MTNGNFHNAKQFRPEPQSKTNPEPGQMPNAKYQIPTAYVIRAKDTASIHRK